MSVTIFPQDSDRLASVIQYATKFCGAKVDTVYGNNKFACLALDPHVHSQNLLTYKDEKHLIESLKRRDKKAVLKRGRPSFIKCSNCLLDSRVSLDLVCSRCGNQIDFAYYVDFVSCQTSLHGPILSRMIAFGDFLSLWSKT